MNVKLLLHQSEVGCHYLKQLVLFFRHLVIRQGTYILSIADPLYTMKMRNSRFRTLRCATIFIAVQYLSRKHNRYDNRKSCRYRSTPKPKTNEAGSCFDIGRLSTSGCLVPTSTFFFLFCLKLNFSVPLVHDININIHGQIVMLHSVHKRKRYSTDQSISSF